MRHEKLVFLVVTVMWMGAACGESGAMPSPGADDGAVRSDAGGIGRDGGLSTNDAGAMGVVDGGVPPGSDAGPPTGSDAGPPLPPLETRACDSDGTCESGETCASCSADCGSCDVLELPMQRSKYVDHACPLMGDGLTDECASAAGGAGRFNALQVALESLVPGDTLFLHPGDYFRDVAGRDSGAIFTIEASGTAGRPIVVTSRHRDRPAVVHSCDPAEPSRCPMPALAAYGSYTILDHLSIRGRVQVWGGTRSGMQYLECTHGWGACGDGNWSCLRIESCTDCFAHHNYAHDISGAGAGEQCTGPVPPDVFNDRGACFKEFQSTGSIWELNTCTRSPYWAFDLHRNSENVTIRFNDFRGFPGSAVRIERTRNSSIYGNVMVAAMQGVGGCLDVHLRNERVETDPHVVEVHHNTCFGANTGYSIVWDLPARVHDNVVGGLARVDEPPRNVVIESAESEASHNAYDTNGNYRRITYESTTWSPDLAAWRAATGWDDSSVAAAGGACTFVRAPSFDGTADWDMQLAGGACMTLGRDGGQVGAYGVTNCVGHLCP